MVQVDLQEGIGDDYSEQLKDVLVGGFSHLIGSAPADSSGDSIG